MTLSKDRLNLSYMEAHEAARQLYVTQILIRSPYGYTIFVYPELCLKNVFS